ncbi:MAG: hypothetical protein Fur0020_02970 [Thermodesulfovibrionia bacterium]
MSAEKDKKAGGCKKPKAKCSAISYHLKCERTSNGLTHFVMYGDVPKKKMPL